jgi:CelD/BcsL family acetyltransferase involved in cellulose biosynthesis
LETATTAIDDSAWGEFVASHPRAGVFHLPAWTAVIADCYRFPSFVLVARDTDGEILAGVPVVAVRSLLGGQRWVSLPFSDSCPVLVRDDADAAETLAALSRHALATNASELEIRSAVPAMADAHHVTVGYHHTLALPSDAAELHPNKGHRYSRNRSKRMGVQVTRGKSAEDVNLYYQLHSLTRQRLGVPVQPRRFFDLVFERLIARGHGEVATARLDGEVVAGGLYLSHNGTLVAKYGASHPAHLDCGAGYLIDWEMMAAACAEGFHTLDLGRTDLESDGLRLYKAGWGGTEAPLVYTHVSQNPLSHERAHVGAFTRGIIRQSPLWVCRALGEALYRWSA